MIVYKIILLPSINSSPNIITPKPGHSACCVCVPLPDIVQYQSRSNVPPLGAPGTNPKPEAPTTTPLVSEPGALGGKRTGPVDNKTSKSKTALI